MYEPHFCLVSLIPQPRIHGGSEGWRNHLRKLGVLVQGCRWKHVTIFSRQRILGQHSKNLHEFYGNAFRIYLQEQEPQQYDWLLIGESIRWQCLSVIKIILTRTYLSIKLTPHPDQTSLEGVIKLSDEHPDHSYVISPSLVWGRVGAGGAVYILTVLQFNPRAFLEDEHLRHVLSPTSFEFNGSPACRLICILSIY